MTHAERLFGALYVSEGFYAMWEARKLLKRGTRPLFHKTKALVSYDRVMTDRSEPALASSFEVRHD